MSGENGFLSSSRTVEASTTSTLVDGGKLGLAEGALHVHVPLEARLDGLGVHRLAVVKLDARPQLDGDDRAVFGGLVRQRQLGHDVELLVDLEELVAERGEHDAADVGARERRIEHIRILGQSNAQRRLGRGRRAHEQNGGEPPYRQDPNLFMRLHSRAGAITARFSPAPWHRTPEIDAAGSAENSGAAADPGGIEETMSRQRWQAVAWASPAGSSGRERLQTSWA